MSVVRSAKWERSVTRMKVVTLFALAIAALAVYGRYSRTRSAAPPLRHEDAVAAALPINAAKHDLIVPQAQPSQTSPKQELPEQSSAGNPEAIEFDNVLSASRQQVIVAIQQPVQSTDGNSTMNEAKAGDPSAEYKAAIRYADGEGVPQSFREAMAWFTKAASKGNANAQWKLALGYLYGIGVQHDEAQAALWFKRAANNGDARAQNALCDIYIAGRGVPTDYVRAYTWANIAAKSANNSTRLDAIQSRMTPAQIQEARRRTSIWYASQKNRGSSGSQAVDARSAHASE